jgi:hypothetical protein
MRTARDNVSTLMGIRGMGLAVCIVLAVAPAAWAGTDLRAVAPVGIAANDSADLAAAGDVNGDGVQDVAVGLQDDLRTRDPASLDEIAAIGFGGASPDPSLPGFSGIVVTHANEPQLFDDRGSVSFGQSGGGSVVGAGDWDGDGLADVAIGAQGAGPDKRPNAGSVYIVLGRREPGTVDVRTDPRVVRIDGPARASEIGAAIGAAGDVDGDGRPDLAIGLPRGQAVIVRGGAPAGTTIDLAHPPAGRTIAVHGLDAGTPPKTKIGDRYPSPSFAAAGDVDGDGRGELLVGVPAADALRGRGRVYVLRGAGSVMDAVLARVLAPKGLAGFGGSVATLPDTDGDGRPEWLIGAATPEGVFGVGGELPSGAFVVFSRARGDVRPGEAGQPVVTVDTRGRGPAAGRALAGIPDATGDGVPDLLIGLPDANPSCRSGAGAIALVPGRRTPGRLRVGTRAVRVDGPHAGAAIGSSIALAGGELFLGARPFENAASLELWRVPLPSGASPALPATGRCMAVTISKRSRAQLRRTGALRVTLRSDAGDGQAHHVRLRAEVDTRTTERGGPQRVIALAHADTRRLTLHLSRRGRELLARSSAVSVIVTAQQRIGSGVRATSGAFAADVLTLH